ncbi:hypothetical protein [Conexibacter woesei]|uniref:Uncharacterized protein n=1 Tax=Conexibacter woesei (strain DSM 14684 / CCUG 47730 / CIP 108061 / JCM 11494 / NBRC 100937 / ID131577) TaxID=469383 RepID=D3FF79_CONWI|nr:hypothetical protein [Conexibacter woesei]ADB51796.1 hypothetical protein Cwoe_3378 [Conexibacter woesei DSM 14684]
MLAPRCVRAGRLPRRIAVRFQLAAAGDVRLVLERRRGDGAPRRCPRTTAGSRPHGSFSVVDRRSVPGRAGANAVTLLRAVRARLRPGTYLLTVTAGTATARSVPTVLKR